MIILLTENKIHGKKEEWFLCRRYVREINQKCCKCSMIAHSRGFKLENGSYWRKGSGTFFKFTSVF